MAVSDSTITENRGVDIVPAAGQVPARPAGLGDGAYAAGTLTLDGTTVAYNHRPGSTTVGSGIHVPAGGSATLRAVLASSNGAANCDGPVPVGLDGPSLSFPASCGAPISTDPLIPATADPVPLLRPAPGSPALDVVPETDPACGGLDRRGAMRPQGTACDLGAVERLQDADVAATAVTTSGATLTGSATDERAGTARLYVGTSPDALSPVGESATVAAGSVVSPALSASLTGLAPGTVHYAQVRIERPASGSDPADTFRGPVRTFTTLTPTPVTPVGPPANDGGPTPTPAPVVVPTRLGLVRLSTTPKTVRVTLRCSAAAGRTCKVALKATTRERRRGDTVIGLRARPKVRTVTVTVARATRTLQPGRSTVVTLKLSKRSRQLLGRFHKLPVTVTASLAGRRAASGRVTVKPARSAKAPRRRT
ncbi:hypothetical protein GKE82_02595 [Conexibacter sp. W3-3-2]|uniref:choice-of-anchor Q domain-containing protein n=1 Tax=Conexibacter sp. W3-3-2 TaxID=2675227 RepID=UPI0012B91D4D|nr:choice-of-anchor Q domain-containing protein [Conexibacter sp. W3-3-2]MTD43221.1 hypothetical protein [Conexibacter sp. W3-3-2]